LKEVAVVGGPYPEAEADEAGHTAAWVLGSERAGANSVRRSSVGSNWCPNSHGMRNEFYLIGAVAMKTMRYHQSLSKRQARLLRSCIACQSANARQSRCSRKVRAPLW
jgi:hypothetical protein